MIPSKLLIGYADAAEHARGTDRFGFDATLRIPNPDAILRDTFDFTGKYDGILREALGKMSRSIAAMPHSLPLERWV